jgi:hypothetical protein
MGIEHLIIFDDKHVRHCRLKPSSRNPRLLLCCLAFFNFGVAMSCEVFKSQISSTSSRIRNKTIQQVEESAYSILEALATDVAQTVIVNFRLK